MIFPCILLSFIGSLLSLKDDDLRVALLVVDFQNDFVNGSLKVINGDAHQNPLNVIKPLNNLITSSQWDMLVYTKDWHPSNHISFLSQVYNPDRRLQNPSLRRTLKFFDTVKFSKPAGIEQALYPDHCVQGSPGSDIYPDIKILPNSHFVLKGQRPDVDSYSAFFDNNRESQTRLNELLREHKINALIIAGLAYDICVKYTSMDAIWLGYKVAVVPECSAGFMKKSIIEAEEDFKANGIAIITAEQAAGIANRSFVPESWK